MYSSSSEQPQAGNNPTAKQAFFFFQYYVVFISGAQHSGQTVTYFTKCFPQCFQYLPGTTRSYFSLIDCVPYVALCVPVIAL